MHDPASKKLSAPDPSKACLKKSAKMVFLHSSTPPNVLSTYCRSPSSSHSSSTRCTTSATGFRIRGTWVYLSMNMRAFGTLWSPRCTTALPTQ